MNKKIEKTLEFQKVRQKLAEYATSEMGKQLLLQLPVETDERKIQKKISQTKDGVNLLRLKQGVPIPRLQDITFVIKRLELEASLNALELAAVLRVLTTTRDVVNFFEKVAEEGIEVPTLLPLADKLVHIPSLTKQLRLSISEDGRVLDEASTALKGIRQGISKAEEAIRQQLNSYLSGKSASYLSDSLITIRNDRYVLPVKAEYKSAFGGTVHDQSASGQTLFIEPQAVVNLNNRLKELQVQERAEITRILWELTEMLFPYTNELKQNQYVLSQFDVVNAKALYAKELKATEPIIDTQNHVALWQARHPLIDQREVVANDIIIGEEYQAIVITGPNTGGKTILLKTVGIIQLMAQSGLFIPALDNSKVGLFTEIFADIGDEQSIEQSLSTFSSHMTSIVDILNHIDEKSLVLLDEIGSGTDPQEGASLAISILDYMATKSSFVIATTHYPELKAYGYNRYGTINASMEFDSDTLQPTYRFLLGVPGRSNAFDISQRLGLPEEVITQAKGYISLENQELNEMISDLEQKRRLVERDSLTIDQQLEESTQLLEELRQEAQALKDQKERLIEEAKEKANQLIDESQEEAEKLISDIRQMQMKSKQSAIKEHEFIEKRSEFGQLKHEQSLKKNKVLRKERAKKQLKPGMSVDVTSFGQRGVLVEKVSEKEWVVQMGIIKMKLPVDDLIGLDNEPEPKKQQVVLRSASQSHVKPELDLRGQRYEAALKEMDRYLDAAILANYPRVTIIHGKGTGALQKGVHKALKRHRSVKSYEYAPMNTGGTGATIVTFK